MQNLPFDKFFQKQFPKKQTGHVVQKNSDKTVEVQMPGRSHPTTMAPTKGGEELSHGSPVTGVSLHGNKNLWVVLENTDDRKEHNGGFPLGTGGDENEETEIPVGTWAQHLGYWFTPGKSLNAIPVLSLTTDEVSIINETLEHSPQNPGEVGVQFDREVLRSRPWVLRKNGTIVYSSPPEPSPSLIFYGVTGAGETRYSSWILTSQTYNPGDVWTADYYYLNSFSSLLLDMSVVWNGTIYVTNFRGIVAFPESDTDQKIAVLGTVYEPDGEIIQQTELTDTIEIVVAGSEDPPDSQPESQTVQLRYAAVPETLSIEGGDGFDLPPQLDTVGDALVQPNANEFQYQVKPNTGLVCYFDYLRKSDGATGWSESWLADGTTNVFILSGSPTTYSTSQGDVEGPVWAFDPAVTPTVTVNSVPDDMAVFFQDRILLSFTPDSGDVVQVTGAQLFDLDLYGESPTIGFDGSYTLNDLYLVLFATIDFEDFTDWVYLMGGDIVRLYKPFQAGDTLSVSYTALVSAGDAHKITQLSILERSLTGGATRRLDTPVTPTVPADLVDPEGNDRLNYGFTFHGGQLFFDPVERCYHIAGPGGLTWRSRGLLSEPVPSQGAHYRVTPWPDDGLSADVTAVDPEYYPAQPRRKHPWLCCSVARKYALQGSWNAVGPRADSDFFLRAWGWRESDGVWRVIRAFSVKDLVQGADNPSTLHINAMGCTTLATSYGSPYGGGSTYQNGWPATRNATHWIVAASWSCEQEEGHDQFTYGYTSAGLTFNAINCATGMIDHQFTIPSLGESDVIQAFTDPSDTRDKGIVDSANFVNIVIDKYFNNNPYYWPSGSDPRPPHEGEYAFIAIPKWNEFPVGQNYWFHYYRLVATNPELTTTLLKSGPPVLHSGGTLTVPSRDGRIDLRMDEDDHIYAIVNKPVFTREQDQFAGSPTKVVRGVFTTSYPEVPFTYSSASMRVIDVGRLIVGADPQPDREWSVYVNGVGQPMIFLPNITGFNSPIRGCVVYQTGIFQGYDGDIPYYRQPAIDVTVYYRAIDVDLLNCAGPTNYSPVRAFERPTFLGFQDSPMPYVGFRVWDYTSQWYKWYLFNTYKTFLYKLKVTSGTITEVWNTEISKLAKPEGLALPERVPLMPTVYLAPLGYIVAGRFIFCVRRGFVDPTKVIPGINLVLDVYPNGETAPSSEPLHSIVLPNSTQTVFSSSTDEALFYDMIADVNAAGREHVTIWMRRAAASGVTNRRQIVQVVMANVAGDPPSVGSVIDEALTPSPYPSADFADTDISRVARVGRTYVWQDFSRRVWVQTMSSD